MKARRSTWAKASIIAGWLAAMGWLVRYEAFPEYFTHTLAGYRDMFSEGQLFLDSWMKILFRDQPVGISRTSVESITDHPEEHYRVENRTLLELPIMGQTQHVVVESAGILDVLYKLQRFEFSMSTRRYLVDVEGRRVDGQRFAVKVKSPGGETRSEVEIPDDVVLYSPMTEMALSRLPPGDTMRLRTLDPASMSVADVLVRSLRREILSSFDGAHETTVLSAEYMGLEVLSWVDAQGRTLRQETPMGWTMEACSAHEAMAFHREAGTDEDMLEASAVPLAGTMRDPDTVREVVLRLSGANTASLSLHTGRQAVIATNGLAVDLRVGSSLRRAAPPGHPADSLTNHLGSTAFLQSDAPAIREKAAALVAGRPTEWDRAHAIYEWVYRSVRKEPTVSLPSAVDVLRELKGDCNEHTYLFVALARAAGLPAQVRAGLLFKDGAFYYHAWPAVWVEGAWVEMDPTIGRPLVGPTHLSLLAGEFADQLKLLAVFGRLKIELLEQSY